VDIHGPTELKYPQVMGPVFT